MQMEMAPEMAGTTEILSRKKKTALDYVGYVFQVLVWIFLILAIIAGAASKGKGKDRDNEVFGDDDGDIAIYILFVIIYVIYLIIEFCSTTCSYLTHKSSNEAIYDRMQRIFSTHPDIVFHCECFHYEFRRNRDGRNYKERITTYREDYSLPYYSSRDVSGLFLLNCNKDVVKNKSFIQLELLYEINFADGISYMDYENTRSDFYMRNRPRDYYMDYNEKRIIPNFTSYNLVRIGNQDSGFVNIGFFVLATLLTCGELYKCFVDKKCVPQRFTVRKIISTRYDLNAPEYNARYQCFMPALDLQNQQYTYQPEEYNYLNNDYSPDLPTQEDLERAGQYGDKVPNYEIENYTSFGGDIKVGVVKDDPSYHSQNYTNQIPPGCAEKDKQYIDQFAAKFGEEGLMKYPSFDK